MILFLLLQQSLTVRHVDCLYFILKVCVKRNAEIRGKIVGGQIFTFKNCCLQRIRPTAHTFENAPFFKIYVFTYSVHSGICTHICFVQNPTKQNHSRKIFLKLGVLDYYLSNEELMKLMTILLIDDIKR